jgi:hypothetical protein
LSVVVGVGVGVFGAAAGDVVDMVADVAGIGISVDG